MICRNFNPGGHGLPVARWLQENYLPPERCKVVLVYDSIRPQSNAT